MLLPNALPRTGKKGHLAHHDVCFTRVSNIQRSLPFPCNFTLVFLTVLLSPCFCTPRALLPNCIFELVRFRETKKLADANSKAASGSMPKTSSQNKAPHRADGLIGFSSMLCRPSRLLPFSILSIVRRSFAQIDECATRLPTALTNVIPDCASCCVESFISDNYPISTCPNDLDLDCLCTNTTPSGLTLGQAALACLRSGCPDGGSDPLTLYNICSGVPGAIPETLGTITATIISDTFIAMASSTGPETITDSALPQSIVLPTSLSQPITFVSASGVPSIPTPTSSPVSASFPSSAISSTIFSSAPMSSGTISSTSNPTVQPDAQTTSSATAIPSTQEHQNKLTTGQIIGISIAGFASALFAFGILAFIFCLRKKRRRRRRNQRWSIETEKQPPRPFTPNQAPAALGGTLTNAAMTSTSPGQRYYATAPASPEDKRRSFWRRSIKPEEIGVAVSPEVLQDGSPASYSSQRTTSQLLPALPNYALWPAPLRMSRQIQCENRASRPESTGTEFEDDLSRNSTIHQVVVVPHNRTGVKVTQKRPPPILTSKAGNRSSGDLRSQMYALERARRASVKAPIPLTPVYDNGNHLPISRNSRSKAAYDGLSPTREEPISSVTPAYHPPSSASRLARPRSYHRVHPTVQKEQPGFYAAPASLFGMPPAGASPGLQQSTVTSSSRYSHPTSNSRHASSRYSAASDTTNFELDDDSTPEQETDKQLKPAMLSPVVESPVRKSNGFARGQSPIKYPRVPPSASVSKQAESINRPRAGRLIDTAGPKPLPLPRDALVRDGHSFLQTNTSSSRDQSPNSLLVKRVGDKAAGQMLQGGLRLNSDAANKVPNQKWTIVHGERSRTPKLTLNTNENGVENGRPEEGNSIGLTPTIRGGDLYLFVD